MAKDNEVYQGVQDGKRVLIVDDDESTRKTLRLIFGKKGYETETAATGREAMEKARGRFFNLALLDIRLPDMEGVELIAPLKEMHPDLVVIMVTAHASLETAVQALNEGASAYITKPLNMDEVWKTVRDALEKQDFVMKKRRLYEAAQRELAERKRVEEALQKQHNFLSTVLQTIAALVAVLDTEGRVILLNRACERATGYSFEEVRGTAFHDLFLLPEEGQKIGALFQEMVADHLPKHGENFWRTKDGRRRLISWSSTCIVDQGGSVQYIIVTGIDLTERTNLESLLIHAQQQKAFGQLAAGIAHEINSPAQKLADHARFLEVAFRDLGRVLEKYDRLLDAVKKNEATADLIREVEAAIDDTDLPNLTAAVAKASRESLNGVGSITRMVRAMETLSHPVTEKRTRVDLNEAIESTITVARNEWRSVAKMVTDLDASLPPVPCLPGELRDLILNVIVSAAHAIAAAVGRGSNGKGTIEVSTRRQGTWAEVRVSHSGSRISGGTRSSSLEYILTTEKVGEASGDELPLAYSRGVNQHGRTTFILRMPIEDAA